MAHPAAVIPEGITDMDGSSLSLIIIPVVVLISLAAWLILVAYAASHPEWKHGPAAPHDARTAMLPGAGVSLSRIDIPRPVRQLAGTRPMVTSGHAGH
jgi:hypothetical protein